MEPPAATVVGLGRVGLPLAVFLASRGVRVKGVESDPRRRETIAAGTLSSNEPLLDDRYARYRERIELTDLAAAISTTDLSFVVVPTLTRSDGALSDEVVRVVVRDIATISSQSGHSHVVVVVSTLMPGTMRGMLTETIRSVGATSAKICYSPVFIALGSVFEGLESPPFVLIGADDEEAGAKLAAFCVSVGYNESLMVRMDSMNAEIAKLALNTFLAMKIAFANSVADLCEAIPGGRADAVLEVIGRDPRVGSKFLRSGPPYGGPCLPRDVDAFTKIAEDHGVRPLLGRAVSEANRNRYLSLLHGILARAPNDGATFGVIGLAYKTSTDYLDDGFGLALARDLVQRGYRVIAHDASMRAANRQPNPGIDLVASVDEVATTCDVCVLTFPDKELGTYLRSVVPKGASVIEVWKSSAQ